MILCAVVSLFPHLLKEVDGVSGFPVHNINTGLNYSTIQSAIDAIQTADGNSIRVDAGTYNETLRVFKGVSLIGDNPYSTIVNGQAEISKSNTLLTKFALKGQVLISGEIQTIEISQNVIMGEVKIGSVSYCNISKNTIIGSGINSGGANHCVVKDNIIENCSEGISIMSCSYWTIEGNDINGNNLSGIFMRDTKNCLVTENSIHHNSIAIWTLENSYNNTVYHNNFFSNQNPLFSPKKQVRSDGGANYWDNGREGNYWDDYNGTDGGDGIGNVPYVIDTSNQDNFPLMHMHTIPEFPPFLILPLFTIATLLAVIIYRKKHADFREVLETFSS